MRPPRAPRKARPGETEFARLFFAGRYAEVVDRTFDAAVEIDEADAAFVVGALTFLGRVEDAQLCFDGLRFRGPVDPRTVTAARFFLGLAYARSGNFEQAHRHLVHHALRRRREEDPWALAVVFQGLACHRYFTGGYRAAARHALRALRAAHVARFGYVQMLANDLRGHALAQLGQYRAGVGLLERAKVHSERLGFGMNAHAIACSIAGYEAELSRAGALPRIEALLERESHDSYSKRSLLAAAAIQHALRGRRTEALRALEEADADALRVDARRAKLATLLARLHVLRWSHGIEACGDLLEQTEQLLAPGDVAFRAEVLGFEALLARAAGDGAREARAVENLHELARTHEHHRSRAMLEQLSALPEQASAFPEDELSSLLRAVVARDARVLHRLVAMGLLGPLPELLGLTPGRRITFLMSENAVLLEDHGDVQLRSSPPRWCAALLRLLASGGGSKQAIVGALWGLRSYRPERHDPLVRTTIHRLRTFLAPHGDWIFVHDAGYGCKVPLHVVGAPEALDLEAPLLEDETPDVELARVPTRTEGRGAAAPRLSPEEKVLAELEGAEAPLGVREISRALGLSQSTTLRALRGLLQDKRVVCTGRARATRYATRRDERGSRGAAG